MSYPEIGRLFDRDHTTIICGCQTVDERMDVDDVFRGRFAKLKREIWAQGKAA
jgi:chromosomal replication initiation ATPase DnaA